MKTRDFIGGDGNIYLEIEDAADGDLLLLDGADIIELYAITGKLAAEIMNRRAKSETATTLAIKR